MFGSHINVEFCVSIVAIKYLMGYPYKGNDLITMEECDRFDEIKRFQTRRYISTCYAYYRLAEFKMAMMKPAVHQLPLHLPDKQNVVFQPDQ